MNQREMAKEAGIGHCHLNRVIQGKKTPSVQLGATLEELTGIPLLVWLKGRKEDRVAAWEKYVKKEER